MNQAPSKKPVFLLFLVDKDNKRRKTNAGAVWDSKFNMNLTLNPGVVLNDEVMERCFINLVPYDDYITRQKQYHNQNDKRDDEEEFDKQDPPW